METSQKNIITALADGFTDAGSRFSFNYPGFHSNELHDALGGETTSVNERSAYAMAWGASIAGARSVVSMKNVGLADAADPFLGSMILGCHAGMVLVVFDDCDLQHSQNRLDSRPWFDFYGGLWFDPLGIDHAYRIARRSFELSERFQVPVVIRITNILYDYSQHEHCRMSRVDSTSPVFQRDPARWVVHPSNAAGHESAIRNRNDNIADYVESLPEYADLAASPRLSIVYGAKRQLDTSGMNRLFTLPLPEKRLRNLLETAESVETWEHGFPYVSEKIRKIIEQKPIGSHVFNNNNRRKFKYHCRDATESLFGVLRSLPNRIVFGDLGGYTMDPHRTLDACLCYGASVAAAAGAAMAAEPGRRIIAVTGDGAFLHSGRTALSEAIRRNICLTVIVFDNGGTRGTGGQPIPGELDDMRDITIYRFDYDRTTASEWAELLDRVPDRPELVIVKTDF